LKATWISFLAVAPWCLITLLHAAVGHEEGVLAAKNVHLIDLHLVAIAAQGNGT
jgi:hypothetical protein